MNDIDRLVTKAQQSAAEKYLRESVADALNEAIRNEASRIAKKYVREHKELIESEALKMFKNGLKNELQRICRKALDDCHLYIDS